MKKIVKTIVWVFTIALLLLAALVLVVGIVSMRNGKPIKIFGYSYSVVVTSSMESDREDAIHANDIIVIKKVDFTSLEVGDIIVFYNPEEDKNISHRIISVQDNGYKTQGDNPITNPGPDTFIVTEEYYIGKVMKSSRALGIGSLLVNNRLVFFIALVAVLGYVIVAEVLTIIKTIEKRKRLLEEEKKMDDLKKQLLEEVKKEIEEEQKNK